MKKLTLFLILILSTLTAFRTTVHAEKMDSETQNLVIEKMERVLSLMTKKDSSWGPTQVRLADLLAERARLRFMNEVEANCDACKGSRSDRKKALSLYQQVLPTLTYTQKGRVYFQMAHLHQMAGEDSSAITIFEGILKNQNSYSNDVVTRAHVALADLLFQNTKFKKAMEHYLLALKDPNVAQKGIIHYRLAWCDFNMDRLPKAIRSLETLARTPSLLTKETSDGKVIADSAFQNDIMRDLATFYSRQKITSDEISTYQSLTPDSQKKELLMFFGQEADRLGQKQAAADIYKIYLATAILDPEEQLEAFMLMAQANYDKGQTAQSTQDFSTAAAAYKKTACYNNPKKTEETQGTCDKIQKRMKHFVTEFHRSKKSKPNTDVLNAYVVYAQTFPQDTQMAILGAQVASELKQHRAAASLYRFGSEFAKDDTLRDKALVGELEATEKTGDAKLKEDVYKRYLAVRPNGANSYKVRYQLAHVNYDKKDWKVASIQFHDLALTPTGNPELRKKSADLALDSLAIQKNDTLIEQWASEFAAALPQHREEFTSIQRKAVLNQTASTANSNKASDSDLKAALRKMQKVSLSNSTDTEKIVHYRNQLVLADKLNDETAILSSLTLLLSVPSLSAEDKEHALARKVGFYEKRLDFKSAYQTALRMRFPNISSAEKEVRLGTLAELAGLRGTAHYKAALDKGLKGPSKATVLSRMIQSSSSPKADIKRYKKAFLQYPGVFSEILILVYNETKNLNDIEPYLKSKKMAQTPAGKFVRKQRFFAKHQAFHKRISSHKLNTSSDRRLQTTIADRIKLLKEADKSVKEANRLNDFTAQIFALSTLSFENNRMVYDLSSLPLPKGLRPQEQAQYMALLKKQSLPYLEKSQVAAQKLNEFWKNEKVIVRLADEYTASRPELRSLLVTELGILIALSPNSGIRAYLKSALGKNAASTTPSQKELVSARESVRANPESVKDLEKLKNLETKSGHTLMVSYLEGRLEQIRTEKSL